MLGWIKITVVAAVIGAPLAVAGWFYVDGLRSKVALLETQLAAKDAVIAEQAAAVESMQADHALAQQVYADTVQELRASDRRADALEEKLARHDLEALARRKPQLMEARLAKGIEDQNRCLELATGAEHTYSELEAARPSEINPICWDIANPNFDYDAQTEAWKRRNPRL